MKHRLATALAAAAAVAGGTACGSQSTSFRPIERSDPNRAGPPSVAYDVRFGDQVFARVHVWSSGGYLGSGDESMTHVGFAISSATLRPLTFDTEALELLVFDQDGVQLPAAPLSLITPRDLTLITVPPASTLMLGMYFHLPVRPRSVGSMQVRWTMRLDADDYRQITGFIRDDDAEVIERVAPALRLPSS